MTVTILKRARDGYTYAGDLDLAVITCPSCGITYAIPERLRDEAWRRGEGRIQWYCPNGHQLGFHGKSEEDKLQELQERLAQEKRRSGRLAAERDQIEASRRAQKAATTRARKRHAAGVCPACNRTFQNVQRHMESQHPDYDPAVGHHEGS